eukprot:scaffold288585_cov19-Tisochrysis_lutea.AAC.1
MLHTSDVAVMCRGAGVLCLDVVRSVRGTRGSCMEAAAGVAPVPFCWAKAAAGAVVGAGKGVGRGS